MILTFIILGITVLLFISDRIRIDIVAVLALLALTLTGIIDTNQALAGFANSTVVTIAALFVVGAGLFKTGVANWLGSKLLQLAGSSETRLLVVLMVGTAVLSAFMSNTGTVAVLLPAVVAAAWSIRSLPSQLLIPLAFAAQIGGLLTLIGTPPNIVLVGALAGAGLRPFGFFEFSLIGLPLLVIGILYMIVVGRRWLPERSVDQREGPSTASLEELTAAYHLDDSLFLLRVRRGSSLVGQSLAEAALGHDYGVTVVSIDRRPVTEGRGRRSRQRPFEAISDSLGLHPADESTLTPGPETVIQADDQLLVEGTRDLVDSLAHRYNLGIWPINPHGEMTQDLLSNEIGMAEILLPPRSALIGRTLAEVNFAEKYNVRVLGISRRGRAIEEKRLTRIRLTFGDALLVRGTWNAIGIMEKEARNFVVVGRPAALAQPVGLSSRAVIALLALAGMLVMLLTGVVSTVIAVIITALIMVLGGCLTMEQAYRAVNWESVILIAAMLPMSTALQVTGGAEFIANGLVNSLGALHPLLLLVGIFLLTTGFTQVISNTATTVLVAPIALTAAGNLDLAPQAVMMMVAVGASTAFLTPIASPVNTLVLTPGGYRFGDFMKVGLPLLVLFMAVSLVLVPLIWPL